MSVINFTKKDDFYKNLYIKEYPFSVTFSWKEKNLKVQLINGEDVLLIAKLFSEFLTNNNIENIIKES